MEDETRVFTYCRNPLYAGPMGWMEKDKSVWLLDWAHFSVQPQCPGPDANASGRLPFHRRLPRSFVSRSDLHLLAWTLVEGIDPSNGLVIRLRWFCSLLRRDCSLQHDPVAEANLGTQFFSQWRRPLFCQIRVFPLSGGARYPSWIWRTSFVRRPYRCLVGADGGCDNRCRRALSSLVVWFGSFPLRRSARVPARNCGTETMVTGLVGLLAFSLMAGESPMYSDSDCPGYTGRVPRSGAGLP